MKSKFLMAMALLIVTTTLFFSSLHSSYAFNINEHYSPELKDCLQDPLHPNPEESVEIYANFFDKFSDIKNASLIYAINKDQQQGSEKMELINGIPSNGTYYGTIPMQNEGVNVNYRIEAKDELDYTFSSESLFEDPPEGFRCQGEYTVTDLEIFEIESVGEPKKQQPIVISADIKDSENSIESVRLYYRNESFDLDTFSSIRGQGAPSNPVDYTSVEMELAVNETGDFEYQTYRATIPSVSTNRSVYYFVEANDDEGNRDRSNIEAYSTESLFANPPHCYEEENKIDITSRISSLDFNDYVANIQFRVSGSPIDNSLFILANFLDLEDYPPFFFELIASFIAQRNSDSYEYGGYLEGTSKENKEVKDIFNFALSQRESLSCGPGYSTISNANNTGFDSVSIPLYGDPLAFPFDHYYIDLMLDVPYRNITFSYTDEPSNLFNTGFSYFRVIENNNTMSPNLNFDCTMNNLDQAWLCQNNLREGSTIMNVKYDFNRNYSIATIIIPLIAIFYLLGAIFLFENSSENISNRLTLTLGIFALIFTLPDIINSQKPSTSAPTIADSMLSIIIIATIAFTISSILGSSSILQKWFPKHHSLIDGIVFIIISGFVISYFSNYLFDSELWWLIPLIIFGLGYGLLLRALGLRINRPLLNIKKAKTL